MVTGIGAVRVLGTWKNLRAYAVIWVKSVTPIIHSNGNEDQKAGECHGEIACTALQSVPVRALRPSLLTDRQESHIVPGLQ